MHRGADRPPYRMEHATDTNVYTNLATGESVTEVESRNENTLRVTNNGDGTLTFLEQGVYRVPMYDETR